MNKCIKDHAQSCSLINMLLIPTQELFLPSMKGCNIGHASLCSVWFLKTFKVDMHGGRKMKCDQFSDSTIMEWRNMSGNQTRNGTMQGGGRQSGIMNVSEMRHSPSCNFWWSSSNK